jgi:iron complex outermembrane receptor protein
MPRSMLAFALALLMGAHSTLPAAAQSNPSPCGTETGTDPASVTGKVVDASGKAVAGAEVLFRCGGSELPVTTALDGTFRVELPAGPYLVVAQQEGFGSVEREVSIPVEPQEPLELQLPLEKFLQTIEVTGRRPSDNFAETSFSLTKTETHVIDLPQSVAAVTKEVIEDQNLMRLNEIAPYVAGVNEFSVYDDLTIRGFRNYDDRRVNGMRTYNNFWSQPLIAHLERVEIVKGPASAVFGAASPGGTINMVTKKPLPTPQREISVNTGNYDTRYAAFDATGPLVSNEKLLYRLNLAYEDSGSFRSQYFNDGLLVAPSLSYLPTDRTRINLDIVHADNESVLDRGQPAIDGSADLGEVPVTLMITQPGDRLDTRATSVNLTLEQKLGDRWAIAGSHMRYIYDEDLVEHRFNDYASPSVVNLLYAERTSESDVVSNTAYVTGLVEAGSLFHRIVAGVDTTVREDFSFDRSARDVGTFDLRNPAYSRRDTGAYDLVASSWGGELETLGFYVQDQMIFGDWQVLVGLRHEDFETTPLGEPTQRDTALTSRLGVVYSIDESTSVYGSWIEGFEPPESWVNTLYYGGPFDPMYSRLFEVGYKKLAFADRLLFTSSVYEIERNDVIIWANDPANIDLYRQRGQERSRGFELEANGRLTPRLQVLANYAYNDTIITEDTLPELIGKRKENAPEHSATLWGQLSLGRGFGLGAGATHVSTRATFDSNLTLPSYTLLNAAVYYEVLRIQLALLGKNLADETHWTGGYYFGRVFPGEPRTVELSARYRF